ncbi:hypothetical protein HHI36_017224 [Cryptolaemus montrouzieri]|uniref:HTH psq-type domain-containing protein n=1 Tax=Cryptolaemus montrouzieri TaxID=559131 RepID=A0ABD2NM75_9CUCU
MRAIAAVQIGKGANSAARIFNIPSRILRCRLHNNDQSKKAMGPTGIFGEANELKLVAHIKALQKTGLVATRDDIRSLAFDSATKLKLKHRFNLEKKKGWMRLV